MSALDSGAPVERIDVSVYRIPTDFPEADGTFAWHASTMVLVEVHAGGACGVGYTYADLGTGQLIRDTLIDVVCGRDVMDVPGCCATQNLHPMEDFHDHARIEHMLFDGALTPIDGLLTPDRSRPGLGLQLKRVTAALCRLTGERMSRDTERLQRIMTALQDAGLKALVCTLAENVLLLSGHWPVVRADRAGSPRWRQIAPHARFPR